ncbi:hypothetical protein PAPYR_3392 [Paratrimastix pyriformis]|uniref:Polymerase nucleotidyl transferase domain-containing protein n=1 Tax=Paratrimastix pyriformis TaxID=342808 RepID=A0ABQ8UMG3_9EUKA|nr:hypothetical protein PAPYR_3392 [Paratrimastix pyriformis]
MLSYYFREDSNYTHKSCTLHPATANLIRRIHALSPVVMAPASPRGTAPVSPRGPIATPVSPRVTAPSSPGTPSAEPLAPSQPSTPTENIRWKDFYGHVERMIRQMGFHVSVGLVCGCFLKDFFTIHTDADLVLCFLNESIDIDCKQVTAIKNTISPDLAEQIFQATRYCDFSTGFPIAGLPPPPHSPSLSPSMSPQSAHGQIGALHVPTSVLSTPPPMPPLSLAPMHPPCPRPAHPHPPPSPKN